MKRMPRVTVLSLLLVGLALPATARDAPTEVPAAKAKDPNETVCEKLQVLGSRLQARQICKTRAAWEEERRLQRQGLDKVQVQRPMDGY